MLPCSNNHLKLGEIKLDLCSSKLSRPYLIEAGLCRFSQPSCSRSRCFDCQKRISLRWFYLSPSTNPIYSRVLLVYERLWHQQGVSFLLQQANSPLSLPFPACGTSRLMACSELFGQCPVSRLPRFQVASRRRATSYPDSQAARGIRTTLPEHSCGEGRRERKETCGPEVPRDR